MASLAEVFVRVVPDLSGFEGDARRQLGRVDVAASGENAGKSFGTGFGRSLKGLAVAVTGALASRELIQGVARSVTAASDLAETANKIQVTFGESSQAVNDFAAGAVTALGQSKTSALNAAATFGTFGRSAGLAGGDLAGFSTGLVSLTSDMASFSNTTPEEAIEAVGAALRGESEPIRRYGVLLDDATLRQRALTLGLIETTTQALTPQQKVLAAQAEIMAQTTAAQGDFARTSEGLANQQRIAAAQTDTLRAKLGDALLPAVTAAAAGVNTQLLPALIDLADRYGPKVSAIALTMTDRVAGFVGSFEYGPIRSFQTGLEQGLLPGIGQADLLFARLGTAVANLRQHFAGFDTGDAGTQMSSLADSSAKLAPLVGRFLSEIPSLNDVLRVAAVTVGFFADHTELLSALMPLLVGGFVAYKAAQLAANAAQLISIPVKITEVVVNRQLVASNRELIASRLVLSGATAAGTVTTAANTAALAVGESMTVRQRVATVASAVAQRATAAATAVWTGAQWLLNAALSANPIGVVIVVLAALAAAVVVAYQRSETFRAVVQAVWRGVQTAVSSGWAVVRPVLEALTGFVGDTVPAAFRTGVAAVGVAWDRLREVAKAPVRFIVDTVINNGIIDNFNRIAEFFGAKGIARLALPRGFAGGGWTGAGPADRVAGVVHGDEHVIQAPSRRRMEGRFPGLLDHINRTGLLPGYQTGGLVRWGTVSPQQWEQLKRAGWRGRPGDRMEALYPPDPTTPRRPGFQGERDGADGLGDIWDKVSGFFTDPLGTLRKAVEGLLGGAADSPFAALLKGVPGKLVAYAADKLKGLLGGGEGVGEIGGVAGGRGWKWQMAFLRSVAPAIDLISGYRISRTRSGALSWHSRDGGRAVDVSPWRPVADRIRAMFGGNTIELITPWAGMDLYRGRPYTYSDAVKGDHDGRTNVAHIHWAYDNGGWLPPGLSMAYNGTGRPERVVGPGQDSGGQFTGTLVLDSGELLGLVHGEIRRANDGVARQVTYGRMP